MSLAQLKKTDSGPAAPSPRKRTGAWLLPGGLLLGFVLVFALLFGRRLLPAHEVTVAPVIALRSSAAEVAAPPDAAPGERPEAPSPADDPAPFPATGPLLFQASGWVEPDPYVTFVSTLVNGFVDEVFVLEGQAVRKDQELATLVNDDATLDLQQAQRRIISIDAQQAAHCAEIPVFEARREAARKSVVAEETRLAELEDSARRLKGLPPGAVPAQDLSQALLKVERQLAVVAAAAAEIPRLDAEIAKINAERNSIDALRKEAETEVARRQLAFDRTVIRAPMDGVVLRLHAAPGKKRMLDMDDPKSAVIVELYDPGKLQARIDVPLTEAAALGIGQPVALSTDLLPDARFDATVTRIVGEADMQRNTLQVKVRIHDPDPRLRPEMLVRAEFFPSPSAGPGAARPDASRSGRLVLFAPAVALVDLDGPAPRAWIVDGDRARQRDLALGTAEREDHREVRSGLRPGDLLILPPHGTLREGKRVRVERSQ